MTAGRKGGSRRTRASATLRRLAMVALVAFAVQAAFGSLASAQDGTGGGGGDGDGYGDGSGSGSGGDDGGAAKGTEGLAAPAPDPAAAQRGPPLADAEPTQVVVLLHHPADDIDPFGVPFRGTDTFAGRHMAIAQQGRFEFPTFVADGVVPVVSVPDPNQPMASTKSAYADAVAQRLAVEAPAGLRLASWLAEGPGGQGRQARIEATVRPVGPIADPQAEAPLHLWVALAEDNIRFQPEGRISNGIDLHRFTVRTVADLGPLDLATGEAALAAHALPLGEDWDEGNLVAAAWLQAGSAFGRFRPGEVVQAAWAPVGQAVEQQGKSVLVEVYSATWCDPCLYGDLAAAELAQELGGAEPPPAPSGPAYFRAPEQPVLALAAAVAAAVAVLAMTRSRP